MPARNRVPSFQIASGTANERDNSYNIPTGSIFFNTDTSNIELSGNVVVAGDISGVKKITFTDGATMNTAGGGALPFEYIQSTTQSEIAGFTGVYPGTTLTLLVKSITPTSASQKVLVQLFY